MIFDTTSVGSNLCGIYFLKFCIQNPIQNCNHSAMHFFFRFIFYFLLLIYSPLICKTYPAFSKRYQEQFMYIPFYLWCWSNVIFSFIKEASECLSIFIHNGGRMLFFIFKRSLWMFISKCSVRKIESHGAKKNCKLKILWCYTHHSYIYIVLWVVRVT